MTKYSEILTLMGTLVATMSEMSTTMEQIQQDIHKAKKSEKRKAKKSEKRKAEREERARLKATITKIQETDPEVPEGFGVEAADVNFFEESSIKYLREWVKNYQSDVKAMKEAAKKAELAEQSYDEEMLEAARAWNEEHDRSEYEAEQEKLEAEANFDTVDFETEPKWRIKPFRNGGASKKKQALYEEWLDKCLEDQSIGIHYAVVNDFTTETYTREQLQERLPKDGSGIHCKSAYRFLDTFLNEIQEGDVAIIGQGKVQARHVIRFTGKAYYDNSEKWIENPVREVPEKIPALGFFHRRKFEYLGELPEGTVMNTPVIATLGKYNKETTTFTPIPSV